MDIDPTIEQRINETETTTELKAYTTAYLLSISNSSQQQFIQTQINNLTKDKTPEAATLKLIIENKNPIQQTHQLRIWLRKIFNIPNATSASALTQTEQENIKKQINTIIDIKIYKQIDQALKEEPKYENIVNRIRIIGEAIISSTITAETLTKVKQATNYHLQNPDVFIQPLGGKSNTAAEIFIHQTLQDLTNYKTRNSSERDKIKSLFSAWTRTILATKEELQQLQSQQINLDQPLTVEQIKYIATELSAKTDEQNKIKTNLAKIFGIPIRHMNRPPKIITNRSKPTPIDKKHQAAIAKHLPKEIIEAKLDTNKNWTVATALTDLTGKINEQEELKQQLSQIQSSLPEAVKSIPITFNKDQQNPGQAQFDKDSNPQLSTNPDSSIDITTILDFIRFLQNKEAPPLQNPKTNHKIHANQTKMATPNRQNPKKQRQRPTKKLRHPNTTRPNKRKSSSRHPKSLKQTSINTTTLAALQKINKPAKPNKISLASLRLCVS